MRILNDLCHTGYIVLDIIVIVRSLYNFISRHMFKFQSNSSGMSAFLLPCLVFSASFLLLVIFSQVSLVPPLAGYDHLTAGHLSFGCPVVWFGNTFYILYTLFVAALAGMMQIVVGDPITSALAAALLVSYNISSTAFFSKSSF
jgi:hypothetical protein